MSSGRRAQARGVHRTWQIFRAMSQEQANPVEAYTFMGQDLAETVSAYLPLAGATAIDIGGGPGYTAHALRQHGATAYTVDPFDSELRLHGRSPDHAVLGDGLGLPFADATLDLTCTLNALEHVPNPWDFLDEMIRVTRPGGIAFVGLTNWLSPWGGHETSPWHYLGGERAAARYERRTGTPPKNRFGESLFRVDVSDVLGWAERCPSARLVDAFPRYYPSWCRPLVKVPGIREVATWNLAVVMERR